jgi:uncharacterized damage-inducible protein DinB
MIEEFCTDLELVQARVLEALSEIPDDRLDWKPTRASTSAAEIVWHVACAERRQAARIRGEDADRLNAAAGTQAWIEAAGRSEADVTAVPRDRAGLEAALASARRETLASLSALTAEQLSEPSGEFAGQPRTRAFWARAIARHHSYHAGQLFTLAALIRGGL